MDQRRRLERMARPLTGHSLGSETSQFGINGRQEFVCSPRLTPLNRLEDLCEIAHRLVKPDGGRTET
jgi:hypothetical protein